MNEKRFHERRISFHSATIFPFQDYSGTLIESDRRKMPDRRLNNIWLELVTLKPGEMLDGWNHIVHRNFS
jgi:hypothetical protein